MARVARGFAAMPRERSTTCVQTGLRVPVDLLLRLRVAAASERKSLNLYLNDLLEAAHPGEDR